MSDVDHEIDARIEQIDDRLLRRRLGAGTAGVGIVASLDGPIPRHLGRHAVHPLAGVDEALGVDQSEAGTARSAGDPLVEGDRFFDQSTRLVGRAHRPAPHGQGRKVMDAIEIDRVVLVFLAVDFAEVATVVAVLACVPVVEGTVFSGDVGIVQVAGIEGRVEGGGGDPVEHHVAHRQERGIADEEHIAGVSLLPGGIQESLEPLGIVHAGGFFQDFLQDGHLNGKVAAAVLHERPDGGLETPRHDDHDACAVRWAAGSVGGLPRAAKGEPPKRRITPKRNRVAMVMAVGGSARSETARRRQTRRESFFRKTKKPDPLFLSVTMCTRLGMAR